MRPMPGNRPMDEDEEDMEGPAESDPEAEESAIGLLLAEPAKEGPMASSSDPQMLIDDIESSLMQLRKRVERMG